MSQNFELKKIKMFVLTSPQIIMCGQRNNGIWFTLVMYLNSTCLDLMVRGLYNVKMRNAYLINALRKLLNLEGGSVMVCVGGVISSVVEEPIVHFHGNINASVYKEHLHQHALHRLRKGTVELSSLVAGRV